MLVEAKRVDRAQAAAARERSAGERARDAQERTTKQHHAEAENSELTSYLGALGGLLALSLKRQAFAFAMMKTTPCLPNFEPGDLARPVPAPPPPVYPPPPKGVGELFHNAKQRHEQEVQQINANYAQATQQFQAQEAVRQRALAEARLRSTRTSRS